jgi:hypothetical protein
VSAAVKIDLTPSVSAITAIAGASFSLVLDLPTGGGYSSSTHTVEFELMSYRGGAAPPAVTVNASWLSANRIRVYMDGDVTETLVGTFGFVVWLAVISDAADRTCAARGKITWEEP